MTWVINAVGTDTTLESTLQAAADEYFAEDTSPQRTAAIDTQFARAIEAAKLLATSDSVVTIHGHEGGDAITVTVVKV